MRIAIVNPAGWVWDSSF